MDPIQVPLNDPQRAVATDVALALEVEDWTALFDQLALAAGSKAGTGCGCPRRCSASLPPC